MGRDKDAFWGDRPAPRERREDRAVRQSDSAVHLLTPMLNRDEHLAIVLPDAWSSRSLFGRVTIAVSARRFFLVTWDGRGRHKNTIVADRHDVHARLITTPDAADSIRLIGPWGRVTVGGTGSRRFREVVNLLNASNT